MPVEKPEFSGGTEIIEVSGSSGEINEAEVIQRAIRGDKDALIMLYEKYIDRVYAYFYSKVRNIAEAEDMTSETFIRAIEALMHRQFVWQGKPFGAWLFKTARYVLAEHRRKIKGLPSMENLDSLLETYEPVSQEADIPDTLIQREEQTALWDLVKTLSSAEQRVLIMRHVYNLPYSEVARRLARSEAASKQLHYRALRRLKRLLKNNASIQ